MFASGMSYAQIAEARGNKVVTVRNSVYRIQEKLGVDTKQEIVVWAVRNGLVDDDEPVGGEWPGHEQGGRSTGLTFLSHSPESRTSKYDVE